MTPAADDNDKRSSLLTHRLSRRAALKGTAASATAGALGVAGWHAAAQQRTPTSAASPTATPTGTPALEPPGQAVIGRTLDESIPARTALPQPPAGAPNILFWVLDDVGYGHLSPYGGPIATPTLQRLVDGGLLYTNFHTTALCSPTRACLLTGRNHHADHMGTVAEISTGYPGYDAHIPFENGFLSEMLVPHGYAAYAIGKWHLTPYEDLHLGGLRDRWPLGRGFERFYGFLGAESNQWEPPALVRDNAFTETPRTPAEGYHLTEDLTDTAIAYIQDLKAVSPTKPFLLYLAYGTAHAPHHAPKAWADRYAGGFDGGWDRLREATYQRQLALGIIPPGTELPPRDPAIPVWESFAADERRLFARMMEVYAGYISHMDSYAGRLLDFLQSIGELDNTLIVVVSDNGASAEGGPVGSVNENLFFNYVPEDLARNVAMLNVLGTPQTYNHYAWGWAWAGNTPFRRWKRETYRGGVSDPLVISWPKGIAGRGERRTQYLHAIDLVPTLLDAIGIAPPATIRGIPQTPVQGLSLLASFADAQAPSPRLTQYYEMFAHRAIYHDGWQAVCPWPLEKPLTAAALQELDPAAWELYHVAEDFAEAHNVAAQYPDKVQEMVERWWVEAGKYNVLPLDPRLASRSLDPSAPATPARAQYVYYPGGGPVPADQAGPPLLNHPHTITAEVEIPAGGAQGALLAEGGRFGGYSFFIQEGTLRYVHNYLGIERYPVVSRTRVPAGVHTLRYTFEVTGKPEIAKGRGASGIGKLFIDGELVGQAAIPVTVPLTWGIGESLTCGRDGPSPVADTYDAPFPFTGTLKRVVVELQGGAASTTAQQQMSAEALLVTQ